jgi:hypothetical protein
MWRSRTPLLAVAAVSLALLLMSVWAMGLKIDEFYRKTDHKLYIFKQVDAREFTYAGHPVTIADHREPGGAESVSVRYGDEEITLPATIQPGSPQLPGLVRHQDWMQILRFVEQGRVTLKEVDRQVKTGILADRLAIVTRTPPPGPERPELGGTFRQDWSFDFYEFKPEGGFAHERREFPGWVRTHRKDLTLERQRELAAGVELSEGTWEFSAALVVMPPLGRPNPKFTGDALPALGWTFPVAGFSGLALTLALATFFAPKRSIAPAPASKP